MPKLAEMTVPAAVDIKHPSIVRLSHMSCESLMVIKDNVIIKIRQTLFLRVAWWTTMY